MEMPEGMELVTVIISAFKNGHWHIFVSCVIMALVWLATKAPVLSDLIKGKAKVWVAAIAGVLSSIAVTAFTSDGDWLAAIGNGLSAGLGATGLFELIRRKIANQPIDEDGDGALDPLPEEVKE